MSQPTLSPKVLELVAKEIAEPFTGVQIVGILEEFGMDHDVIQYPNTKWRTLNEAFKYIKKNHENPDDQICKLIEMFVDPIQHSLNYESVGSLVKELRKYLGHDDFYITEMGKGYFVSSAEELDEMSAPDEEFVEEYEKSLQKEKVRLTSDIEQVKKLKDYHQTYMDTIELFCENPKKPTDDLNNAYLFLGKKMDDLINGLGLEYYTITLYKPFRDLYSAESLWEIDEVIPGRISWDAIRPKLYLTHSSIDNLYNTLGKDDMTDDEKKLEEINTLISEKRAPKVSAIKKVNEKSRKKQESIKHEHVHRFENSIQEKDIKLSATSQPTKKAPKIKLSDFEVSFDNETAQLHVGEFNPVQFPPYKNEHYVMRKIFSCRKNEPIDWQNIYEAMAHNPSETTDKEKIKKQKNSVRDTVRAVNNRVREVLNTDCELLKWEIKCVRRQY